MTNFVTKFMTKFGKCLGTAFVMGALLTVATGCEKKEGPAETAGKAVDDAASKVGEKVEQAGEKIKDTAQGNK